MLYTCIVLCVVYCDYNHTHVCGCVIQMCTGCMHGVDILHMCVFYTRSYCVPCGCVWCFVTCVVL